MQAQDAVRFVVREARLLDEKRFEEWYELFAEDGHYWVPAAPGQTDPHLHNSLAYEDRFLLKLRVERLKSPLAYSQQPESRCLHVLQAPEVEQASAEEFLVRTPFLYTETRGDDSQRYAATAWHTLVVRNQSLRIKLKRVDILNCDAMLPSIQLFL
ncbi:MAG TPA: aromatic-ring-hydroxylating dioxygenase subunit beta [Burkholderiales bacterium]|nr:aromatic-ring-hydroxylating dioxygenase subunit beta [Burkholderiales bacterium]